MTEIDNMVSPSAEATVIATALKHPEFTLHSEMLKPAYFYFPENGCWMWAINSLYEQGITNIDAINLTNIINSNAAVSNVMKTKGIDNINQYIELSSYAARETLEEYMMSVKEVVSMAYKRDMHGTLGKLDKDCINPEVDLRTLEKHIREGINKVTEKYIIDDDMHSDGEDIEDMYEEIESDRNSDGTYGIPTIFPSLTKLGLVHERGEMIMINAAYKTGKSTILLNEFTDKLNREMSCIYHDTEMSNKLFTIRMLANLTGIPQDQIKSGRLSKTELESLRSVMAWLKKQKYKHIYAPNFNEVEIYNQYKVFMYRYGDNIMGFYDYFKSNDKDTSRNYNILGIQANFMKNEIAGGLQIPILSAAQLNRVGQIADSIKLDMYVSAGITYKMKTSQQILDDGGLDAGNYTLHLDFARNAQVMSDNEYINISTDGARMRVQEAKKQPIQVNPFDNKEDDSDDGN